MSILSSIIRRLPLAMAVSFDEYQRYALVSSLLTKSGCETVLDVGGGSGLIRRFLKNKKTLVLDLEQGDVIGSGLALPFSDRSFDAVCAVDVLHYIRRDERVKFLSELARVGAKYLVIAGPFDEPAIRKAERECNQFYRRLYKDDYYWLRPSIHKGLPELAELVEVFPRHKTRIFDNGPLNLWTIMLKLEFLIGYRRILFPLKLAINCVNNLLIYRLAKHRKPTFRKVILVSLQEEL